MVAKELIEDSYDAKISGKDPLYAGYDYLVTAIVKQAMGDYCNNVREIKKLEEKIKNIDSIVIRDRKPNEPLKRYNAYKVRHSQSYFERKIYEKEEEVKSSIDFLKGDWLKTISDLDGRMLLEVCNKELEKEGLSYEVNRGQRCKDLRKG